MVRHNHNLRCACKCEKFGVIVNNLDDTANLRCAKCSRIYPFAREVTLRRIDYGATIAKNKG